MPGKRAGVGQQRATGKQRSPGDMNARDERGGKELSGGASEQFAMRKEFESRAPPLRPRMPPYRCATARELDLVRRWLDSWAGIGPLVVAMAHKPRASDPRTLQVGKLHGRSCRNTG
jgi:hypothetical protein